MFDSLFPSHWTTLRKLMWLKLKGASAVWDTITGNPVSFTAKAAPLRQLSVAFSPKQEGSGDPSPDNVRPISGWDSLTVEQRGKNLFDLTSETLVDNYFVKHSDGGRTGNNLYCMTDYLDVSSLNGKTLITTPGLPSFASSPGFAFYDADKTFLSGANYNVQVNGFVVPNGAKYMRLSFYKEYITNGQVMVEFGTERTSYTPYNPLSRSISISLGQTVYGGYVDVISGVLTVTHIKKTILTTTGVFGATANGYVAYVGVDGATHLDPLVESCKSNIFKWSQEGYTNMPLYSYGGNSGAPTTMSFVLPSTVTSKAEADAWFAANPTECTFALATPISIQLTPQEVQSLLGVNNMWSTANGNLTVEYRSN